MDTSETYIKMCEKAVEIQDKWYLHCGDYVLASHNDKRVVIISEGEIDLEQGGDLVKVMFPHSYEDIFTYYDRRNMVWLPRQDQLQAMVNTDWLITWGRFVLWYKDYELPTIASDCGSFEQLWLAFVMKEKYNKVWNGEDWIQDKDGQ